MKKLICCILAAALTACLVLTVAAAEVTACTVTAESAPAIAGGTVTVPIRISGSTGFTNFGIALDYDRDALTLTALDAGEDSLLAGAAVSANVNWIGADGMTYGYLTCASPEKITGDGLLFTATFHVKEEFSGTATITPLIQYIRDGSVAQSGFENIDAGIESGIVTSVRYGDLNNDGKINSTDVSLARAIVNNKLTPSEAQFTAADVNGDGKISATDVSLLRAYANNKLTQFPVESK